MDINLGAYPPLRRGISSSVSVEDQKTHPRVPHKALTDSPFDTCSATGCRALVPTIRNHSPTQEHNCLLEGLSWQAGKSGQRGDQPKEMRPFAHFAVYPI
jgi:hypothetical protein